LENERFDALTRALGGRGSRRAAIAAALAAIAGRTAAPALAQQNGTGEDCLRPGTSCDNNPTMWWRSNSCKLCCSGFPEPNGDGWRCGCTPKGGGCGTSAACCDRRSCDYGVCGGPECLPDGAKCDSRTPCCTGLYCDPYGWCKPDPNYVAPAPPAAPAAAPEAAPVGVTLDTSTSTDGTTDTAIASPDGGTDTASADGGVERECRPTNRGCTLNEQCCSGTCLATGNCG
jgi:hypothetical protein